LERDARPDDRGNLCWAQGQEEHREPGVYNGSVKIALTQKGMFL
jgi:hypothetical protein